MKQEYLVIATGLVQGVCFRALVSERARSYDLCGYVKNLKDGTVEIRVQGEKDVIDRFLENLQHDTGHARVDHLFIELVEPIVIFSSFKIH